MTVQAVSVARPARILISPHHARDSHSVLSTIGDIQRVSYEPQDQALPPIAVVLPAPTSHLVAPGRQVNRELPTLVDASGVGVTAT